MRGARPAVSVVVPLGRLEDLESLQAALARLDVEPGDELIIADNTRRGMSDAVLPAGARVVRAAAERSSYHARNAGARAAGCEWILFMDADCTPAPGLIRSYFTPPPAGRCGAVAGTVVGSFAQDALIARYARSRAFLNMAGGAEGPGWRIAVGGTVLVRRAALEEIGGFVEGIRSGGDVDLSRRLIAAGWTIERRRAALVEHRHRERLLPFLASIARYAAGSRWLNGCYPGHSPRWPLPKQLALSARDAAVLTVAGKREEGVFRALDGLGLLAHNLGYLGGNAAPARGPE